MTPIDGDRAGVALCLSGRGYQAMLFQAGCVLRLNQLGWLPRLDCVTSVSGGALAAAALGQAWGALEFDRDGVATNLSALVIDPLRRLASETIDEWSILGAAFSVLSPGEIIADALDEHLFGGCRLADLPDHTHGAPRFVFGASSSGSGSLVTFSRSGGADSHGRALADTDLRLALAVAASVSSPPWLSTVLPLRSPPESAPEDGSTDGSVGTQVTLVDGSVADSLAIEALPGFCRILLVSDGDSGAVRPPVPSDCTLDAARVVDVISAQLRASQRRELLNALDRTHGDGRRAGVYWNMSGASSGAGRPAGASPSIATACAPALHAIDASEQAPLIGWGEAVCGVALSHWLAANPAAPAHYFQLPPSPISV